MIYSKPSQVPTDTLAVANSESLDEKTGVSFGARDLRTRSPAYMRDKILDLKGQIGVLETRLKTQLGLSHSDKSKLCKLQHTLRVFNKKLHS